MDGFLDNYGASDAKRERIIKSLLIAVLLVAAVSGALYFFLRDYQEKRVLAAFLADLNRKDFQSAYSRWGCSADKPCKDYGFEKFLKDWGPESTVAKAGSVSIFKSHSCDDTVIQIWMIGSEKINLLVNRKDQLVGFAPWPVCDPHMKMP